MLLSTPYIIMAIIVAVSATINVIASIYVTSIIFSTWITSITGLIIIWILWWMFHKGKDIFDSSTMVLFGLSFTHILPPLYLSLRFEESFAADMFNVAGKYALTNNISTVGAVGILVGYYFVRKWKETGNENINIVIGIEIKSVNAIMVFIFIVVWTARMILLKSGAYYFINVDYDFMGGRWFSTLSQVSYYGLMLPMTLCLLANYDKRWLPLAILFSLLELFWVIPTGGRQYIIQVCLSLMLVNINNFRKIPLSLFIMFGLVIIITFPILGQLRYTSGMYLNKDEYNIGMSQYYAFKDATDVVAESESELVVMDHMVSRFYDGQFLGYLLENYGNDFDWQYGKTYLERLPYVLMPYFIFQDRPIMQLPLGQWYQLIAGGSQPTTYLGEAYINFGYIGIIPMSLLLGILLGLFDNIYKMFSYSILFKASYMLFLVTFMYNMSNSLGAWLAEMRNIVVFNIVIYIVIVLLGKRNMRYGFNLHTTR